MRIQPGDRYEVTFRKERQTYKRVMIGDYLGLTRRGKTQPSKLQFSLRPKAGTAVLTIEEICDVRKVPSNTPIQLPKVVK